jgi:sporadic carbohydrate cluster 2OG-Fe(II) oxygenase
MNLINDFTDNENTIVNKFIENGFIIEKCSNLDGLHEMREYIFTEMKKNFNFNFPKDIDETFNNLHLFIHQDKINEIRMFLYSKINEQKWLRPTFFSFAKDLIETLISNELVMQNKINLSIMMPKDGTSNIPMHVDTHSGESPFQCVVWLPLVNVYETKGMYVLPPKENLKLMEDFSIIMKNGGQKKINDLIQPHLKWPKIDFGNFLLFSPNYLHGSVVNITKETRWSLNTRFKSLFSPYGSKEKGLGNFYSPIQIAPITKLGMNYSPPKGLISNE